MADNANVIKGLEEFKADFKPFCGIKADWKKVDDAINLLKEQEPLKPMRVEIEQAGPLYHRCYCQKCGHHVGNMIQNKVTDVHENYCSNCGHEVKWDENP